MAGRNSYDLTVDRGIRQRHWNNCPARDGKRCNCRPQAFVAQATVDGKRRWSPTLRSLNDARVWRSRAITDQLEPDSTPEPDGPTFSAIYRRWYDAASNGSALTKRRQPYKATTLADYDHAMTSHILPILGEVPAQKVDSTMLQTAIDQLAERGVSPTRQASAATAARAVARWASRRGTGQRIGEIELPQVPRRKPRIMSPAEVGDLLDQVKHDRARAAAAIAAYAGPRALEIMSLDASQVDLATHRIAILEGKTDAATRELPIIDDLAPHLDVLASEGPLFGRALPRSTYRTVAGHLARAWADLDQPPTLHVLRHNFVSWMLAAGVPYPAAQRISGHRTPFAPGVTLSVYGHAVDDHVDDARERLNAWISAQL